MNGSPWVNGILIAVPVLGVMIFVHELGHFLAAKGLGVRVITFSLGFGKRLLGFKRGTTDYRLSLIPLGGYVKMAGDDPTKPLEGASDEFLAKPRWQRFFIVLMGPAMNVIMAVVLLAGLYRFHYGKPAYLGEPALVGDVVPKSPAAIAGVLPGDLIVRIGNVSDPKWEDVGLKMLTAAGGALAVEVERQGRRMAVTVTPLLEGRERTSFVGWLPCVTPVIDSVQNGLPASRAGMLPGDEVLALNGADVTCPRLGLVQGMQAAGGKAVTLTILRGGSRREIKVTPIFGQVEGVSKWIIGVRLTDKVVVRSLPLWQALQVSLQENLQVCGLTFETLASILTRPKALQEFSGPIGIVQMTGEASREGPVQLLRFVSFVSLSLGIFNLLPIPILDGGVILLLLIEGIRRRDLSLQVKERILQFGFVFLLLLAVFVMYNDIMRNFRPY